MSSGVTSGRWENSVGICKAWGPEGGSTPSTAVWTKRATSSVLAPWAGLSGALAIAGVTYHLADGRAVLREHVGDIGVS